MSDSAETNDTAIASLRHELKIWETSFAAANGGRKPGREDIKNDATISGKYKEYDGLRRKPAKAHSTPRKSRRPEAAKDDSKALRERSSNATSVTPRKRSKDTKNLEVPAVPEEEPTPACVRCALGPTPQKDGQVLGIFDMLPNRTPSKDASAAAVAASGLVVGATPSKPVVPTSSEAELSRTPQSSGKRFYLEAFAGTPLKRKRDDDEYTSSTARLQFTTPSFLRRIFPFPRIDEDGQEAQMAGPPFKKRGLVRSLSTIIQGLKKQEEERMDDEWEVMNEIESEERAEIEQPGAPKVLAEDSQAVEMPLGPDQRVESSDEGDEVDAGALDANGRPRKVWKKKGLKRQTRRVIMRPVLHKPKKATDAAPADSGESEPEAVAETQQPESRLAQSEGALSDDEDRASGDEADDLDYNHDSQQSHDEPTKQTSKKHKQKKAKAKDQKQATADGARPAKSKKVSAQAHANFRKLKIKNKNSKANGRGRKFGRK